MKRVICEVCRGSDILKNNGVFICQSCGCKYSLEEVRKMLVEDDSEKQISETLPHANQADEYMNMLKAAREAMMDGRFDTAHTISIWLISMKPDVPELIAIQALAILGKEKLTHDIPSSTCKGMERFYSIFSTWKAQYSEQVIAIRNVQSYVDIACRTQMTVFRKEISELDSRQYTPSMEDSITQLGDAIGMLSDDLYSTVHGIGMERDGRWMEEENSALVDQIEKTKEKERKVEAFKREQTAKLAQLLQLAQSAYAQAKQDNLDEPSSWQNTADCYTVINDREIICNKCGSVQPIRRIKGVCWKCGIRLSLL